MGFKVPIFQVIYVVKVSITTFQILIAKFAAIYSFLFNTLFF